MVTQEKSGIKEKVIEEIINLAKVYNVERVYLFGSRARGDYKRTSDIDLAFCGGKAAQFILAVDEETSTLLEFDVLDLDKCRDEDIRASIDREGVLMYEKHKDPNSLIMKIWAHRGCSQIYPENTITAFEKALEIPELTGIELDIQLTSDGELVVIHDERVDRTTDGFGFVKDYTLKELKSLQIFTGRGMQSERIPTMSEVFELLKDRMGKFCNKQADGIQLNIELKTSRFHYDGIEEKIVSMAEAYGLGDAIIYSSFYVESLVNIHELSPTSEIGVLDGPVSNCLYKAIGLESLWDDMEDKKIALHPAGFSIDIPKAKFQGRSVRGYFGGHLFPEEPTAGKMNLEKLAANGVTDVFLNEPEKYL